LTFGIRKIIVQVFGELVNKFIHLCDIYLQSQDYALARDFIVQTKTLFISQYNKMLDEMCKQSQVEFSKLLTSDPNFWMICKSEWGQGPGFRKRVSNITEEWFKDTERLKVLDDINQLISNHWYKILQYMIDML
jgi:hypothetical protein